MSLRPVLMLCSQGGSRPHESGSTLSLHILQRKSAAKKSCIPSTLGADSDNFGDFWSIYRFYDAFCYYLA